MFKKISSNDQKLNTKKDMAKSKNSPVQFLRSSWFKYLLLFLLLIPAILFGYNYTYSNSVNMKAATKQEIENIMYEYESKIDSQDKTILELQTNASELEANIEDLAKEKDTIEGEYQKVGKLLISYKNEIENLKKEIEDLKKANASYKQNYTYTSPTRLQTTCMTITGVVHCF